ncbi:MAG: tyrosine-type recombinase/integrase [Clostridia bacterium]|nr:tyrosine-type recombinase/integrase [Clostridia bacterium]
MCEKYGLCRIKLHELRHTNIRIFLETGASIKELQEQTGHSNYTVTANIYSHIQASSKIKLSKASEEAL